MPASLRRRTAALTSGASGALRITPREFRLQRGLDRGGEPVRGLHHDVDHEYPAGQPQLAALLVQVGDGLPDVVDGARADAAAVVEDTVHGGLAHAGLPGDVADRVRVGHTAILMGC